MIRIAVAGCGNGAQRHHLPLLARMPDVEIVAVADPDPSRRAAALRHAPHAVAHADHRDALADVDALVLCLPSALHAEAAIAALERRRHVYVEKPLATALGDADRVVAAWRRAGVVGMMGFNYRFNRLYRSAKRLLDARAIGELVAARSVFSIADRDLPTWKRTRREGGGALLDLGSHHVDLVRHLFGEPVVEVSAEARSRRSEDDTVTVSLRMATGLVVQSLFAFGSADTERFEIVGSDGTLTVDRRRHQDAVIERPGDRRSRLGSIARALASAPYVLEKRRVPGHEPSHRIAFERFVAAIRGEVVTSPDLDDGRSCLAIVDAAERSARSGRPVTLPVPAAGARQAESTRG